jgi:hypothetical protein
MTEVTTVRFAVAGGACGLLAAWLVGAYLHLRLLRASTAGSRRFVEVMLPMSRNNAMRELVSAVTHHPHFAASITGYMEGILTAVVWPVRGSRLWSKDAPAGSLTFRLEDLDDETRVQIRIDAGMLRERVARLSRAVLFFAWPAWIAATMGAVAWGLGSGRIASPAGALHMFHGTYPIVGLLALNGLFARTSESLSRAVATLAENLRFLRSS